MFRFSGSLVPEGRETRLQLTQKLSETLISSPVRDATRTCPTLREVALRHVVRSLFWKSCP